MMSSSRCPDGEPHFAFDLSDGSRQCLRCGAILRPPVSVLAVAQRVADLEARVAALEAAVEALRKLAAPRE
jgi:hypothetical protein